MERTNLDDFFNTWVQSQIAERQGIACALADENLIVQTFNTAMETRFNGRGRGLLGSSLIEVFPELAPAESYLRHLAAYGGPPFKHSRLERRATDGSRRYFDIRLEAGRGAAPGLLVYLLEVTEEIHLGEELKLHYNRLHRQHSHMRATNKRLARIVHHFVPEEVAARLINTHHTSRVGDEMRQASILFADARDFTPVAEEMQPGQVMDALNAHFDLLSQAVLEQHGTLIQFVGDNMMAAFNLPNNLPDHPAQAARAAIKMRRRLQVISAEWGAAGLPVLGFGIGVNTGPVIAGFLGAEDRYEYTAIGDTTNVAFHLCSQARQNQIVISQTTLDHLGEAANVRPLGTIQLKHRRTPLPVYELVSLAER